jgi:hypothetical protein
MGYMGSRYVARLLDQEGRVVRTMVVEASAYGPPRTLKLPGRSRMSAMEAQATEAPNAHGPADVEFVVERVAGDGVLIYRRTTPLWG